MSKEIKPINRNKMLDFFNQFDGFRHKFFSNASHDNDADLKEKIIKLFYFQNVPGHDLSEINEIYQTMDKVYHYGGVRNSEEMEILEYARDKFLIQYADIEGIQELFRPSFFNFEWMMHLEYVQKKHDYSYYRDHYLHQIRNLYEMFVFLQDMGMWRNCMEIYRQRKNTVANRMAESVEKQNEVLSFDHRDVLKRSFGDVDEWCYHYIIFATAIVSALVHDIGYPITYMKRNLNTLQDFLPLSNLFMGLDDGIPRIKSLLGGSLLFETVDNGEIIRRLRADDHGAYSAIILLCMYYDNGRIFGLEPIKRMVIELSALVIYNHTLRYHFQDEKGYDRYQNVFTDNPISFLFRLCDDMQEWERVYFEITGKGAIFICDRCKMPMIRRKNQADDYVCKCGTKGINTVWFPYRRMMNVAPFDEAVLREFQKAGEYAEEGRRTLRTTEQKWVLELKCDKGALLQLAKYNPNFATQRARGIRELRGLVGSQSGFPRIFVKAFVTNNPIAIKVKILREFLQKEKIIGDDLDSVIKIEYSEKEFQTRCKSLIEEIRQEIFKRRNNGKICNRVYKTFVTRCGDKWKMSKNQHTDSVEKMLKNSIGFYLFILLFCEIVCKIEFVSNESGNIDNKSVKKKREKYELALNGIFAGFTKEIANAWAITDPELTDLIADCIVCMYGDISEEDFFEKQNTFRHNLRTPLRADIKEILKKYTREPDDSESMGNTYDYYSDYYFYYMMDCLNSHNISQQ